jgi:Lrp/AsnC family transcriptional regulator
MTEMRLDRLDVLILEEIQRDVTVPLADLAETVRSSKSAVWRRIQGMVENGVIRRQVAVVNPRSVGLNTLVFVRVRMASQSREILPQFIEAVQAYPEVVECHPLLGDIDFLLKVLVPSLEDYEHFARKLSRVEGVRQLVASVSLSQVVSTTRIPLGSAIANNGLAT